MQLHNWKKAKDVLKNGGVIIAPTDTLYGVLTRAEDEKAVKRIYNIKGRDDNKPLIVLITSIASLQKFDITLDDMQKKFLQRIWPGKVSVILSCPNKKFDYIHRGKKSIAFRMIGKRQARLSTLINSVGPLVAPSANLQGQKPSYTVWEAKHYFGDKVDLYLCGGRRVAKPSTLIEYKNSKPIILRQGEVHIKKD